MRSTLLIAAVAAVIAGSRALPPIRKVVILMQENRSFDHLLGFLKAQHPELDGLNGDETNPYDPQNPAAGTVTVSADSGYVTDPDPGHGVRDNQFQSYGSLLPEDIVDVAPMNGYIANYAGRNGGNNGADVMKCFDPADLPVSSTLALEFGVIDRWFCSVAGPTMPNRYYLMAATSQGVSDNSVEPIVRGFTAKSIFASMEESGYNWANYFALAPSPLAYKDTRAREGNFHHISTFAEDARQGLLPELTLIDPLFFSTPRFPANDDHPDHDVSLGQKLMKDIYEPLRASPYWNETLFIITYDEHGGFFDKYPTPKDVPNPDGIVADDFDFTRLGPRVPTIMISPWIDARTVLHGPSGPYPTSQFEHSSVHATLKKMFNLTSFLTERDAWAGTFEGIFSNRTTPRTDCPETLPEPRPLGHRKVLTGNEPLSHLQEQLVEIVAAVNGAHKAIPADMTVAEGAHFVRKMVNRFFKKNMYPAEEWDPSWDWNAD